MTGVFLKVKDLVTVLHPVVAHQKASNCTARSVDTLLLLASCEISQRVCCKTHSQGQSRQAMHWLARQVISWSFWAIISRVSDQNGVSLLYIMLEIHHSGWEPLIYSLKMHRFARSVCYGFEVSHMMTKFLLITTSFMQTQKKLPLAAHRVVPFTTVFTPALLYTSVICSSHCTSLLFPPELCFEQYCFQTSVSRFDGLDLTFFQVIKSFSIMAR